MSEETRNTLWGSESLDDQLDAYTVGEDREWDRRLLSWDVIGNLGHLHGLVLAGVVSDEDAASLRSELRQALEHVIAGTLTVTGNDEDAHSAIEKALTASLGEVGEKIHTGRSRNDQVQVDLRLYLKDALHRMQGEILRLGESLVELGMREAETIWPGYTHQRRAMPSTVGLWAGSFAESLLDDLVLLDSIYRLVDRSPLGSAAGYGVPLPLDRDAVAAALGFAEVQRNVIAVQSSRGKLEASLLSSLWSVGYDLGKLSWDLILFSGDEYGFLRLPDALTTGSSIMPQKRNPDVLEITRGRSHLLQGYVLQAMSVSGALPSGYHRDLQLVKGIVIRATEETFEAVAMVRRVIEGMSVDRERCAEAVSGDLLATDEVFRRVRTGESFRSAYRSVSKSLHDPDTRSPGNEVEPPDAEAILEARSYPGAPGNPGLEQVRDRLRDEAVALERRSRTFHDTLEKLTGGPLPFVFTSEDDRG